jgi:hypothetical protein
MNEAVEAAKLPPRERLIRTQELHDEVSDAPLLVQLLLPTVLKLANVDVRTLVKLCCARAAIAVERFRLKNNRWPDSLDEVVASKLLDKVPEDPYDGKPLRYRKTTDGVVVYSISEKGNYAGDALDQDREFNPNITRTEFRLWDEAHRRQPPRAKNEDVKKGAGPSGVR